MKAEPKKPLSQEIYEYYRALIAAGFLLDQAWQLTMDAHKALVTTRLSEESN